MGDQNTTKALIPSAVGGDYSPWVCGLSARISLALPAIVPESL